MMIRSHRFNIYLLLILTLGLVVAVGCRSPEGKRKKANSTLRLYQEMNPDPMGRTQQIPIYREHPITFTVSRAYFLSEANVTKATVVDAMGGYALHIQFDRQGSWLLEQFTAASRGKHIAVFSQFAGEDGKLNQGRWLAAPKIINHTTDGLFIFTPDATREEAQQVAVGLNNVAKKLKTGSDDNL